MGLVGRDGADGQRSVNWAGGKGPFNGDVVKRAGGNGSVNGGGGKETVNGLLGWDLLTQLLGWDLLTGIE